ncbi:MAG: TauD/TfdA family dioxygenase [Methyloligellaceae bacterium]
MPSILETPLTGSMAWRSETLLPNDGKVVLDADCLTEIKQVAQELGSNPFPIEALKPEMFAMPNCRATMASVREQIEDGIGFAIIDRIPLDEIKVETAKKIYWLLMNMVSQTVAQKWDGTLVYDVTDTHVKEAAGNGIRSSKTNSGQSFHTDNAFNLPPSHVALFCLQTAREGGISGLVSLETVYNDLLENHTDCLHRLYEPFYFDRQREHGDGEKLTSFKPIAIYDGKNIEFNFSPRLVQQGYKVEGIDMETATKNAIQTLIDVSEKTYYCKSFEFEIGQIQIVNNRRLGHRRTAYTDDPDAPRHLIRLWLRNHGKPYYAG